MISFQVNDMTCGHCAGRITRALHAVDQNAQVRIDLAAHRVEIEPGAAHADALGKAIKEAGYMPVAVGNPAGPSLANAAPTRKGCCCG
ncbi:MAG: copZ [Variovorax sp.]|nr:copZ [Variovorax sp.]